MRNSAVNSLYRILTPIATFATGLTSPASSYASSITDARRFSVLIALLCVISGYLFIVEIERRTRLTEIILYDEILSAIENFSQYSSENATTNVDQASLATSQVLNQLNLLDVRTSEPEITTISGSVRSCDINYYRVNPEPKNQYLIGLTDRQSVPITLVEDHLLIEFTLSCNIFHQEDAFYALIGKFRLALAPQGTESTFGALYDRRSDEESIGAGSPFYATESDVRNRLLRLATNVTGKYYAPINYELAIIDLLSEVQGSPTILGIVLPAKWTVIFLPIALAILSFSLYHRIRRIEDTNESIWIVIHVEGTLERIVAVFWKILLLVSSLMVYLTASLYNHPSAELRGESDYFMEQSFSTEAVGMFSRDLWLGGTNSIYVVAMCLISLFFIILSFLVLRNLRSEKSSESDKTESGAR